jgi:hypothetical protein
MNTRILSGVLQSDAGWWRAHMALPAIVRQELPALRSGVEVGVAFGSMSVWLLRLIPELSMISVDPFLTYDPLDSMSDFVSDHGDELHEFVRGRLSSEFLDRSRLLRMPSTEAAGLIADGSQDFVFIDADHRYEAVRDDLAAWLPKVRLGGLICGHDYSNGFPGVNRAVSEQLRGRTVHVHGPSTIWFSKVE